MQRANSKVAVIAEHSPAGLRTMIVVWSKCTWCAFALANIALVFTLSTFTVILHQGHPVLALQLSITSFEIYLSLVTLVIAMSYLLIQLWVGFTPLLHTFNLGGTVAPIVGLACALFRAVPQVLSCGCLFTNFLTEVTHEVRWALSCCYCSAVRVICSSCTDFRAVVHRSLSIRFLHKRLLALLAESWHGRIVTGFYTACQEVL